MIPIAVGERSIAFPRRSVKAGVNKARNLCPNPGKQLIPGQPAGEHDVQADAVRQNAAVVFFQFADDGQNGIALEAIQHPPDFALLETAGLIWKHVFGDVLQELVEYVVERVKVNEIRRVFLISCGNALDDDIGNIL